MNNKWLLFYFSFNGRASRYDFNVRYTIVTVIGYIVAALLDFISAGGNLLAASDGPFSSLWNLVVIIPTFAITCKRLHDINLSGWWQLIVYLSSALVVVILFSMVGMSFFVDPLAAGIGGFMALAAVLIAYLVFFILLSVKHGTKGPNKYGSDPLEVHHV